MWNDVFGLMSVQLSSGGNGMTKVAKGANFYSHRFGEVAKKVGDLAK